MWARAGRRKSPRDNVVHANSSETGDTNGEASAHAKSAQRAPYAGYVGAERLRQRLDAQTSSQKAQRCPGVLLLFRREVAHDGTAFAPNVGSMPSSYIACTSTVQL